MTTIDVTHDMNATSWVEGAQGSDFPIQNLPWGVCSTNGIVVAGRFFAGRSGACTG